MRKTAKKPAKGQTPMDQEPLHLRGVQRAIIEELDAVAAALTAERGSRVTRSDVVRELLSKGLREGLLAPQRRVEPSKDVVARAV